MTACTRTDARPASAIAGLSHTPRISWLGFFDPPHRWAHGRAARWRVPRTRRHSVESGGECCSGAGVGTQEQGWLGELLGAGSDVPS